MLAEPTAAEQAAARAKEQAEQDALPYKWQQTIGDLDVTITGIPGNFKSRDLVVEIKKQSVKAGIKGQDPVISVCALPITVLDAEPAREMQTQTRKTDTSCVRHRVTSTSQFMSMRAPGRSRPPRTAQRRSRSTWTRSTRWSGGRT